MAVAITIRHCLHFDEPHSDRNDTTTNIATGNEPETIYMVASGTHFNGGCCKSCAEYKRGMLGKNEVQNNKPQCQPLMHLH